MKSILVAYTAIGLATFIWQLYAHDYFNNCEYNAGACSAVVEDFSLKAVVWPVYLLL